MMRRTPPLLVFGLEGVFLATPEDQASLRCPFEALDAAGVPGFYLRPHALTLADRLRDHAQVALWGASPRERVEPLALALCHRLDLTPRFIWAYEDLVPVYRDIHTGEHGFLEEISIEPPAAEFSRKAYAHLMWQRQLQITGVKSLKRLHTLGLDPQDAWLIDDLPQHARLQSERALIVPTFSLRGWELREAQDERHYVASLASEGYFDDQDRALLDLLDELEQRGLLG